MQTQYRRKGRMKIPTPLADAAYQVVMARHKIELKSDLKALYTLLDRLMLNGVSERELMDVLRHDHWESKLAKRKDELPPWVA